MIIERLTFAADDRFCDSDTLNILTVAMLFPGDRPSPRLIANLLLRMAVEVVAPVRL